MRRGRREGAPHLRRMRRARRSARPSDGGGPRAAVVGPQGAIGALGQLAPNYYVLDGVVPRTKLPEVMQGVMAVSKRDGFAIANVFHAGDGNLHPYILFDERKRARRRACSTPGEAIMRALRRAGGSVTGEHGIGLEKRDFMPWIFSRGGHRRRWRG